MTQAAVGVSLNQRVLVVDRGSFGGKTCILPPLSWLPERDAGAVSIETAKTVNALADVLAGGSQCITTATRTALDQAEVPSTGWLGVWAGETALGGGRTPG